VVFDWQRQLSKWAGVQDRLREWVPSVRAKIERFSCLAIMMLDIDGFRLDKATQITVDALGNYSSAMRECASMVGKDNFLITGEIAGGNNFGSVYLGRGRQPDMKVNTFEDAFTLNNNSNSSLFIRDPGQNALDGAAFHMSVYRSLTRFLGLDGMIEGGQDTPDNFIQAWNEMVLTNDLVNANTNTFDPRHMLGTSNQDTFRWPALKDGTERMLLGQFITTLLFPGIPLLLWGEEQAFYTLDNTASNYLFGRQAMSSSLAWELHSCYKLGSSEYNNFPLDSALHGCEDPWNRLDHRDVTNPTRNIIKSMYQMRQNYPVLNDGWYLEQLSNQTHDIYLPASGDHPTETGMWSVMRSAFDTIQDLSGYPSSQGNQPVWLVYQNDNRTVKYQFDCTDNDTALIAPFDAGTTVKNLFYPHDEHVLIPGPVKLGLSDSSEFNGCLADLTLAPYEYRAYVPLSSFVPTGPMVTAFLPGHDARQNSSVGPGQQDTVPIEFQFSAPMDCAIIESSLSFGINSTTEDQTLAKLDEASISCGPITNPKPMPLVGGIPSVWSFKANLTGVSNGIHELTLSYIPTLDNTSTTEVC
jgi:alpha-1,3-glucan synthase